MLTGFDKSNHAQNLGKWIPVGETNPTSLDAEHDPYVLWRQIQPKLHSVISEENALNERLYSLQTRCEEDERVILQAIQKVIKDHSEQVNKEAQYAITIANEINGILLLVAWLTGSNCNASPSREGMGKF